MSFLTIDRAYTNLLTHLQRPSSGLPLQTIVSAVPHYLAQLPLPHPTQLTAFVISSSLWQPLSVNRIGSLTTTYRSAVHLKWSNLQKEAGGWFSRSPGALLEAWVAAVVKGVSRGDSQLRIAILGGILLGLDDLRSEEIQIGIREKLEREVVIACAEVLEAISTTKDTWKVEFTVGGSRKDEDAHETIFLCSACQILHLVTSDKINALNVPALIRLGEHGIKTAFSSGQFLAHLSPSSKQESGGQVTISSESSLVTSLREIRKHPLYNVIPSLAKLLSRCLSLVAEYTPATAWNIFKDVTEDMESMASNVGKDWTDSLLAGLTSEQDIEPQTREISTEIWKVLKTLLFAHLMVSQTILSSIPYLRPPPQSSESSPSSISRSALLSLYHMSFVLPQFGGVTTPAEEFKELKRTFYTALDILAADVDSQPSFKFIEDLILGLRGPPMDPGHPVRQAKTAYVLAVIEQLVPVLSESNIENNVIPFCHPYLDDPTYRETYESAHSVVLSIFSAHAQRGGEKRTAKTTLAQRLVPFYVNSLAKNSSDGGLTTVQLRLAYSNLVRSAAASGDDALAWLCIEALLSWIETSTPTLSSPPMHLYLTLISLISCVPLSLLLRELVEVETVLERVDGENRAELANAVLEEITRRVGDREREIVLSWWCGVAPMVDVAAKQKEVE